MNEKYDIAIVGGGMAGASLAAELAGEASIIVLEAEERPGYHATGRSAAFWTESYGGPMVQPLTTASGPFLREAGFLSPRGALTIGRERDEHLIDDFVARFSALDVTVERLSREGLERHLPRLRQGWSHGALEPNCCDIDVAALHQHYLSHARKRGAQVRLRSRLMAAQPDRAGWLVELEDGVQVRCGILVNAAGAWVDSVAQAAGVRPIGFEPLRRTMVQLAVSPPASETLPLVLDANEKFYFKPEAGGLWLSPHDETPSAPCDATPEEIDLALAIDRFEGVMDWPIDRLTHRWAGLRTFAPDRLPVYGFDPRNSRFFWFAGQGGFGIQTAPAAARLGASLLLAKDQREVDPHLFLPQRFA